jgi:hypothetical protein
MDNNEYLQVVADNLKAPMDSRSRRILEHFKQTITKWGGKYLEAITIIGSTIQGCSIRKEEGLDVDLMISFAPDVPFSLAELHDSLKKLLTKNGFKNRTRNFAVKTKVNGVDVDLVVARREPGVKGYRDGYHDVYSTKKKIVVPSNPKLHSQIIRNSGKQDVIRLMKRWIVVHKLTVPSFVMALVVVEASKKFDKSDGLLVNFSQVIKYLATEFRYVSYVDPANPNDNLSDQMTEAEKKAVEAKAKECLKKEINDIIW